MGEERIKAFSAWGLLLDLSPPTQKYLRPEKVLPLPVVSWLSSLVCEAVQSPLAAATLWCTSPPASRGEGGGYVLSSYRGGSTHWLSHLSSFVVSPRLLLLGRP